MKQEPLHQWELRDVRDLPVPEEQRRVTDVCCLILGVLFGLIMFIVACCSYSGDNLKRSNYPTDSKGMVCMMDTQTGVNNYPFLYFNDLNDPSKERHCVQECPQKGVATHCYDNCTVTYYPNYPSSTRLGAFCLPEDDNLKDQLLYQAKITERSNNLKALDYMLGGLGIAFGLSLIWLALVQFIPKAVYWIALLTAALMLLVAMLVFFIGSGNTLVEGQGWAILLGIICLALLVAVVLYAIFNRKQIYLVGCFLEIAGDYLKQNWSTLIWVPIFIGLTFLFGLLTVFQYLAFSSSGSLAYKSGDVYYSTVSTWFTKFLLAIQTLWGLSFFRDMYNYIISGLSCEWYFKRETTWYTPVRRLFCRNIGSVASGSLLSSILFIPSLLVSFFFPSSDCCLCNFFDLTRSDSYAYIYLTGNSFCPSSRHAQYLCHRSAISKANQSMIEVYTFVARTVLALASVLIAYWIARDNLVESKVPPYLLLGVFFACLYITCYCSDLHAIIAQAVLLCFLAECELDEGWSYQKMRNCPHKLRDLVTDIQSKNQHGFPIPYSHTQPTEPAQSNLSNNPNNNFNNPNNNFNNLNNSVNNRQSFNDPNNNFNNLDNSVSNRNSVNNRNNVSNLNNSVNNRNDGASNLNSLNNSNTRNNPQQPF